MQTINEDIKNGTFKPVYLLYGEEAFLKQSYKKKLRAAISGDDTMNYNYFEGKGHKIFRYYNSSGANSHAVCVLKLSLLKQVTAIKKAYILLMK